MLSPSLLRHGQGAATIDRDGAAEDHAGVVKRQRRRKSTVMLSAIAQLVMLVPEVSVSDAGDHDDLALDRSAPGVGPLA